MHASRARDRPSRQPSRLGQFRVPLSGMPDRVRTACQQAGFGRRNFRQRSVPVWVWAANPHAVPAVRAGPQAPARRITQATHSDEEPVAGEEAAPEAAEARAAEVCSAKAAAEAAHAWTGETTAESAAKAAHARAAKSAAAVESPTTVEPAAAAAHAGKRVGGRDREHRRHGGGRESNDG